MQFIKLKHLILTSIISIIINTTSSQAQIIKLTSCKYIEMPHSEKIHKTFNEVLKKEGKNIVPYSKKKDLDETNNKYEFIDRFFDTDTKILTFKSKKFNEDIFINKTNFEIKDINIFSIVDLNERGYDPYFDENKKLKFKSTRVQYFLYYYYLSEGIVEKYEYVGKQKNLISRQKCNTNFTLPDLNNENNVSSGSGFFINKNGYFITNNHVIEDCRSRSQITFKNKDIEVDLIAKDPNLDLAVLKANVSPDNFLKFSSDRPEKLQKIIVAGYPFGKGLSDDLKFTQGIISSLKGFEDNSNELQIDAAINPGNSGGPIVDEKSNLVAVAVSGLSKEVAEGINFGIKSSSVMNFLDVNSIKYSYSKTSDKNVGNKKLSKILEEATIYTYCN